MLRYYVTSEEITAHSSNNCLPQDITRIAHLVSKTVKSNVPCTEFEPGQQMDINAVLTAVEDFIRLGNQSGDSSQDKLQPGQNTAGPQPSGA